MSHFAFLDHPGPIPFAHRGGALESPENTWEAFRHARELGYRYLETDVHCTRDGVVLAFHDQDLSRTTGTSGLIREVRWESLQSARPTGSSSPIPRLDELLEEWPEARWNIDAKHDSVVGPLIETIHRSRAIDRICVTSFSDRRLARVRRAFGPKLCTGMGPAGTGALRVASLLGGRAAENLGRRISGFGAAQVPLRQGRIPLVDRRLLDTARRFDLDVHVWTVDDSATMEWLLDLGVDGIMTDRPSALKEVLQKRGAWVSS